MNTRIKICGLTTREDIALCEELGVDYIGLNFVPDSPRSIPAMQALELRQAITTAKAVGIFVDTPLHQLERALQMLDLDLVQLHGNEDVDYVRSLSVSVIKAFRYLPDEEELETYLHAGCQILLDGKVNGDQADWENIAQLPVEIREQLFLAGGLTPDNVAEAIAIVQPFAVDTASGVEREPGVKDHDLLTAFCQSSHSVS